MDAEERKEGFSKERGAKSKKKVTSEGFDRREK